MDMRLLLNLILSDSCLAIIKIDKHLDYFTAITGSFKRLLHSGFAANAPSTHNFLLLNC